MSPLHGLVLFVFLLLLSAASAQVSGSWLRNEMTGCYVWNTNPELGKTFNWSGDCQNNVAQGRGVLQWYVNGMPNGRYVGEYDDGRMSGRGVFEYRNGDRYDGEFRDDKPNGHGTLSSVNGARYTGLFLDGRPARGEATTGGGKSYEGMFRDGRPARGEVTYPDGSVYNGELVGDARSGRGVLEYENGDRDEGDFRNDQFRGWGVFTTASGDRFEGEFDDDRPNGFGTYTAAHGGIYAGLWTNGCFRQGSRVAAVLATLKECGFKSSP